MNKRLWIFLWGSTVPSFFSYSILLKNRKLVLSFRRNIGKIQIPFTGDLFVSIHTLEDRKIREKILLCAFHDYLIIASSYNLIIIYLIKVSNRSEIFKMARFSNYPKVYDRICIILLEFFFLMFLCIISLIIVSKKASGHSFRLSHWTLL